MFTRKWDFILAVAFSILLLDCSVVRSQGSLPTNWQDQDVGTVGIAGSASYANGVFTVNGAGAGTLNVSSDGLNFAYQTLSGNGTIIARVVSRSSNYAQAGVMIRQSLTANDESMFVMEYTSEPYSVYRTTTGSTSAYSSYGATATPPYWVELVRSGNTFTGYASPDGLNWVQVGTSQSISMAQNVYVGLGVSSGVTYAAYTATFDNVSINSSANPAPLITAISATTASVGSQVVISGSGFGASQGNSVVWLNGATVTIDSWSATSITVTIPSGATSGYLAVSVAPSMNDSNPVDFTVTASPLPTGWLDQDVGIVGIAGSASFSGGVFSIKGAGPGTMNVSSDGLHFAYQPLSGNGTIIARVVSRSSSSAQVGIMIRQTLEANDESMFVPYTSSTTYGVYRTTTGGTSAYSSGPSGTLPYWLELVRSGNTFTGYASPDGENWVQVGTSQIINMTQNVYVGLGVSSGVTYAAYNVTFDNVSVSTTASPAPQISGVSATTGSVGSQIVITGSGFGSSQSSSLVLLNDAPMTINSWSGTSITVTIPTGATSGDLAVSVAPGMNDSNPVDFTVTTNPLPTGWLDQDIGIVGTAGSASYTGGVFSIIGAGPGTMNVSSDGLHFAYQLLSGNGTIIARVVSTSSTYAQAGVMIRGSLEANAESMFVADYAGVIYGIPRATPGANSSYIYGPGGVTLPYWVKLVRTGNSLIAYAAPDGVSWTIVAGPFPIDMNQNVYVGLGVSSGATNTAYTATFDNVSVSTTSSPAPQITSVSATTGSVGNQVVISGTGFGSSQGSSVVLLHDTPVTINSWGATSITITIPTGATSGLLAVLLGPDMISSNTIYFSVTSQPLSAGWLDEDVGIVGTIGSASYASGVFTVKGAGASITGSADAFHFVYQPLATNGAIIARVVSQTTNSQAGVIIRETLDAGSAETLTYLRQSSQGVTAYMDYRAFEGGLVQQSGGVAVASPYWVEVIRSANSFSSYVSPDGGTWTQVGTTQTYTTAQTVYVGLAVSSGSTSSLATATFDNVSMGRGASLSDPIISGVSPTTGATGTPVTITGSGFGSAQGSSSVLFNGATATASSWSDSQVVVPVPYGATTGPVSVTVANITAQGPNFTIAFTVQLTDSLGNQTSYTSSVSGAQWNFTAAQGSGCSSCTARGNIQNQYDSYGNLLWTTDALGNMTGNAYDASGDLTTQFTPLNSSAAATTTYTYNSFGEVLTITDPLGHVTTNTYDSHGNLLTVTTPIPSSGVSASVTHFAYNSLGEMTQITDPLNRVTTMTYTSAGLIATITDPQSNVTTYAYDSRGNRTSITDAMHNQTTFAYDAGNRLLTITYPGGTTSSFTYDYRGRRITATDQNGKTTSYAYDDADQLTSVTDPTSNITQYSYDTENNLRSITDANSHVTDFTYDAFGRVKQTTFPSNFVETYSYDADNNLTSKTDRNGQSIQYVYDALNRVIQKTYPDSTSVEYTYDLVGKIQQVTDPSGTYGFSYDNMNRLVGTSTQYTFLPNTNYAAAYTYDADSNRTSMTDPQGGVTSYAYDTLNRLSTLTPPSAFSGGSFGFSYDALSRRTQMTRPNSVTTNYSYDSLSHLLSVLHQVGGSTIDGATYTVDSAGNRTAKNDMYAGVTSNYTYNPLYELTQVTQATNTTESYSYDPVGNRLSSLGVSPYSVNSSNELTSTPSATYTYDNNGNTLTKVTSAGTTTYGWDYENRLASIALPSTGGSLAFKYDGLGHRVQKAFTQGSTTTTTNYLYDGNNAVADVDQNGNVLARYAATQNIDEPLAELRSSVTSFYSQDGLGSITSLTTSAGALGNAYRYDSFGNLTASGGSITNRFQYAAREFDPETGLDFYRARYYDPTAGRFLSEDPIGLDGGIDLYAFVVNNPVGQRDPFGRSPSGKDKWYGYNDPHFQKWFHRCWKLAGDPDASKAEIAKAYDEWVRRGKPQNGKCGNSPPAGNLITKFECDQNEESNRDMEKFWKDILYGDAVLGVVGTLGAFGVFGGGAAAGGAVAAPPPEPLPFPKPLPLPPPVPLKPAA